jgi:predicted enzyme related to lactoylglutathione lyase
VPLQIVVDCRDAKALARFWIEALGYQRRGGVGQYVSIQPTGGSGPKIIFQQVDEPKTVKNRVHFDYSAPDIDAEADRVVALGASRAPEGVIEEFGIRWIRMLDPEGNEFCIERR